MNFFQGCKIHNYYLYSVCTSLNQSQYLMTEKSLLGRKRHQKHKGILKMLLYTFSFLFFLQVANCKLLIGVRSLTPPRGLDPLTLKVLVFFFFSLA